MSETVLAGEVRETGRKGPARRLRTQGKLPGIVYGKGDNLPITVNAKEVIKILEEKGGANKIISTKFEGDKRERHVMIKALDVHPIYDTLLHIDLMEVDVTKKVIVNVPVAFTGVARGVKEQGGMFNINMSKLSVQCLPGDIPVVIEVAIDEMDSGSSIRVSEVKVDDKITLLDNADLRLAAIATPKAEVEETDAEGETAEGTEASEGGADDKPDEKAKG